MDEREIIQYITEKVVTQVKGGFSSQEELNDNIKEDLEGSFDEPKPELQAELQALTVQLFAEQRKEEAQWLEFTSNDAIDDAFKELNTSGIVALQNAGYTMSHGWEDANQAAYEMTPPPRGAIFYHGQDVERGVMGLGLMLAFGAYEDDDAKRDEASLTIAREAIEILRQHHVATEWDGTLEERIRISPFLWRKRQFGPAPAPKEPHP
ncbi:hypothetical protein [Deinococcus sp.]|uniref:DUF6891 domain-containing protein n=1 Tax=Deinococcus sp. TaxID=47478 RepID=UPI0025FFFD5E|nr:hypothetical protein [Deinococcus sp.]